MRLRHGGRPGPGSPFLPLALPAPGTGDPDGRRRSRQLLDGPPHARRLRRRLPPAVRRQRGNQGRRALHGRRAADLLPRSPGADGVAVGGPLPPGGHHPRRRDAALHGLRRRHAAALAARHRGRRPAQRRDGAVLPRQQRRGSVGARCASPRVERRPDRGGGGAADHAGRSGRTGRDVRTGRGRGRQPGVPGGPGRCQPGQRPDRSPRSPCRVHDHRCARSRRRGRRGRGRRRRDVAGPDVRTAAGRRLQRRGQPGRRGRQPGPRVRIVHGRPEAQAPAGERPARGRASGHPGGPRGVAHRRDPAPVDALPRRVGAARRTARAQLRPPGQRHRQRVAELQRPVGRAAVRARRAPGAPQLLRRRGGLDAGGVRGGRPQGVRAGPAGRDDQARAGGRVLVLGDLPPPGRDRGAAGQPARGAHLASELRLHARRHARRRARLRGQRLLHRQSLPARPRRPAWLRRDLRGVPHAPEGAAREPPAAQAQHAGAR